MHVANQHIVVMGLGRTGQALVRFLVKRGAIVTATDSRRGTFTVGSAKAVSPVETSNPDSAFFSRGVK